MSEEWRYRVKVCLPGSKSGERRGHVSELPIGYIVRSKTKGFELRKLRSDHFDYTEAVAATFVVLEAIQGDTQPAFLFIPVKKKRRLTVKPRRE